MTWSASVPALVPIDHRRPAGTPAALVWASWTCTGNLYIIGFMPNRTTYTQARAHLAALCDEVAESREPYVIERRDKENVALISEAELDSLLETAHLLRSPRNAARLAAALERARGEEPAPTSVAELRRELGIGDDDPA